MSPARKTLDRFENPDRHLPLTPLAFHILLALADQPRHGYAIIQDIEARTEGAMMLRSGTLYTAIRRLESDGLLKQEKRRPAPDQDDQRRRYYCLTELGRQVARLEARRLTQMLATARGRKLVRSGEAGR